MHPEVVWDSKHLRDCWFCRIWVCMSIFMRWTWRSSFFFLQQKSLRAHSCFSEAVFCGTRKDHAKRSLANHGRQSLVNHAKLSLRSPPGRCESQSEIYHPPSMLWWLCKQQKVSTNCTDVPNPWETSRLFQTGQSWEFAEYPQHWIYHTWLLNPIIRSWSGWGFSYQLTVF